MKVFNVDPQRLRPYENNPRINDGAVEAVAKSIDEFGFKVPIVVDSDYVIIAGHTRLKAAEKLGLKTVPVVIADDLTEEQARAFRLADNKTAELAEWDFEKLNEELGDITDLDMQDFGFERLKGWFDIENRSSRDKQDDNDDYNEFLEKFGIKHTTDDCYTPDIVYNAVADWVANEYGVNKNNFVRPFYPNGDYQNEKYKNKDIVVDNPPFSIYSEITRYYTENNIKFFLFAPHLTLFSSNVTGVCCLGVGVTITYENGAKVDTSFVTNLEDSQCRSAPSLYAAVKKANDDNLKQDKIELPKYVYPNNLLTASNLNNYSKYGVDIKIPKESARRVRELDAQKESGKTIYGGGFLISEKAAAEKAAAEKAAAEKAAAEKAAAEKAAAEKAAATRWELSEREWEIVKSLK